ncbi:MAG TPA: protein kinase, partial [Coriobacteriia bacterium]|nr:protein kinase [Coriobacteriia bacterium]
MDQPLILDRYRPLAELGAGGHGTVTLAYDTKMARRVAIKRLQIPTADTARTRTRTGLAEARTAALLNHPGIVTVHEWESDGGEAFIVMEFLDGLSVADLLDETGQPLDEDCAAAVLSTVVAAVSFAHANGVLHLDLKP